MNQTIASISLELSQDEAIALTQFIRKSTSEDYRKLAVNDDEAQHMLTVAEKVRAANANSGAKLMNVLINDEMALS